MMRLILYSFVYHFNIYQGTKLGDHRASVFVLGIPVIDPGVSFKVRRPGALEEDVMRKLLFLYLINMMYGTLD